VRLAGKFAFTLGVRQNFGMTVSRLRVAKSETREMGERWRVSSSSMSGDVDEWHMSNATFLKVFIAIAAVLTLLAIVLR
jgi:hypothetical protein